MIFDVPPRVHPHLGDPSRSLVVTEGPLKADASLSAGLDAVALLGVWAWRGTNDEGGKVALAAWEHVALNGRPVYVAFDSDVMLKPQVHEALARLAAFLKLRGAEVAYVYLPSATPVRQGRARRLPRPPARASDAPRPRRRPELRQVARRAGHRPSRSTRSTTCPTSPAGRCSTTSPPCSTGSSPGRPVQRYAVALWIAHTYLLDVFDSTPRLVRSYRRRSSRGKTRVLELRRAARPLGPAPPCRCRPPTCTALVEDNLADAC